MRFLQVQNKLQTKPQSKVIPLAKSKFRKLKRQERMRAGSVLERSVTSSTPCRPLIVPLPRHAMLCSGGVEGERNRLADVGCRTAGRSRAAPLSCVFRVMPPMRQFLCPLGCSISVLGVLSRRLPGSKGQNLFSLNIRNPLLHPQYKVYVCNLWHFGSASPSHLLPSVPRVLSSSTLTEQGKPR